MFRPISINLIRQALAWEGIKPVRVECTSTFKWPDGSTHGYYVITLDGAWVRQVTGEWLLADDSIAAREMVRRAQQAFCEDGQIARHWVNADSDILQLQLLMKVLADGDHAV